jgi:hypothetical protein
MAIGGKLAPDYSGGMKKTEDNKKTTTNIGGVNVRGRGKR